jgi:mono/diheme cytochrome c family protein
VPAEFVPARKVFDTACAKCHTIDGKGGIAGGPGPGGPGPGGPRPRGPDLGRVGAKHDRDWIVEHIRDPHAHKPNSRMPQFGVDRLSDADARAIGDYLASLKGA